MRAFGFGLAALFFVVGQAWAQTPPLEAYGRLPAISSAALSPDGTRVALARYEGGRAQVQIVDIERRTVIFAGAAADRDNLRSVGWADDNRVFFVASRAVRPGEVLPRNMYFRGAPRRVEYYRTGIIDIGTQSMQILTTNPLEPWNDMGSDLIAPIEGSPNIALMIGRAPSTENNTLYRIDLRSGGSREWTPMGTNRDTLDFIIGERGHVIARIDSNRNSNRWGVYVYDGEDPRLLVEGVNDYGSPLAVAGLLADGRLAAIDDANGFYVVRAIDRRSGESEILFQREGYEIGGAIRDPWTRRVVGAHWVELEESQAFFDPALQAIYGRVRAETGTNGARLVSWSRDRSRVLVYAEQGMDGGAYYVFTPATNAFVRLSYRYPEIAAAAAAHGERQSLNYRARDGARIPAYLTLPPGAEARNLPTVVLVHGGPAQRDTMDFDWWASFLASRGYAVLQPNFRGSGGYGAAWERAGHGQWGGLMQTDVEDGVDALVQAGVADAGRVCIVGASYGGYAALAGATLTPDRYRCAASIAGVSDLNEFMRWRAAQSGERSSSSDYWRTSIGDRDDDRERIRSLSPANLADRVRIPILLIHGDEDTIVPIEQSRRMRARLQSAGRNVRFVELRGDDHYLSDAETRIQMLRELETFLAQNLGS